MIKNIFLLTIAVFCTAIIESDNGLFDKVYFQNGKSVLQHIPVSFQSIGKNPFDMSKLSDYEVNVKSHTALEFKYNDIMYYLPINNSAKCDFIDTCKNGDILYVDIIVFDTIDTITTKKTGVKIYYSYITAINR